jgi:hypothetical protein
MRPTVKVKLRAKKEGTENGLEKWAGKSIALVNYMRPHLWYRIDIVPTIEYRDPQQGGRVVKTEERTESKKTYNWSASKDGKNGKDWWATYRY